MNGEALYALWAENIWNTQLHSADDWEDLSSKDHELWNEFALLVAQHLDEGDEE